MSNKTLTTAGHWVRKSLVAGVIMGLGMTMASTSTFAHDDDEECFEIFPFNRVATMPVVRGIGGVDYKATYEKARAASVYLANYVATNVEATLLGEELIQGIDWKLGGTSEDCLDYLDCTDHEIDEAVLAIPSTEPIDPTDPAYVEDGTVTAENTKKGNVLDFCNKKYASLAMGVDPIVGSEEDGDALYVVNGFSHAPALPCEVSIWNDDKHIYVDMLSPSAIFTLFFTDVVFGENMQDEDFAAAMNAMPAQVKAEIQAIIIAALTEFDQETVAMNQQIGPVFKSLEEIDAVVDASPYDSPYLHMSYTRSDGGTFTEEESKAVAQAIINTLTTHEDEDIGVHTTVINEDGDTLDSILSENSSWRSARLEPISIPGKNHIIEACSPYYAKMAMSTGLHHVNALPCEITVKIIDDGNKLVVSYLDPAFMMSALFADITDEEKEQLADIPSAIIADLQNIVWAALTITSEIPMNAPTQISFDMLAPEGFFDVEVEDEVEDEVEIQIGEGNVYPYEEVWY